MKHPIFLFAALVIILASFTFPSPNSNFSVTATPVSGLTNFNSLYAGSFVDLTGPGSQSAGGAGLLAANVAGYNFRLFAATNVADCGIGIEPFTGQTAMVYGYTQSGGTTLTALELSSNDGKFFDLNSVDITIDGNATTVAKTVRLVGYRAGSPVAGALLAQSVLGASYGGLLVNFNVAANTNFIGIDKFRIETNGSYTIDGAIGVDNVNAVNFRSVLPVTLEFYTAAIAGSKAQLSWRTSNEINNNRFVMDRSWDGIAFTSVATIPAKSSNGNFTDYSYTDEKPFAGSNFYRLKQIDADGQEKILGTKTLNFGFRNTPSIYPNPVKSNSITILNATNNTATGIYGISDVSGKTVAGGIIISPLQQIDISTLQKGMYFFHLQNGQTIKFQKN